MPKKASRRKKKEVQPSSASVYSLNKQEDRRAVKPPAFIQLESLNELSRLTCAFERVPLPVFASKRDEAATAGYLLSTQLDLFAGASVFYYAYSNEVKHFLGYKTGPLSEEIALVDLPLNPGMIYAPIIEIVKFPEIFEKAMSGKTPYKGPQFQAFQVKDVMSIVKVASYKVLFEEPPLPMFAFPVADSEKWIIGAFTRIEEYEEASIFFYCQLEKRPEQNYVGYSATRSQAFFTNKIDEHGNMYVKIIRLKEPHPLVGIND